MDRNKNKRVIEMLTGIQNGGALLLSSWQSLVSCIWKLRAFLLAHWILLYAVVVATWLVEIQQGLFKILYLP